MCKKALPFIKLDPLLILTVGGRELNAWINNELEKKEYAINSAGEKSTHPSVKHMPRPQSQQGDPSEEVAGQSSWGAAGQANRWLGRHFQSSAGNQRHKRGEGGRMRHITEPLQTVSVGKSQDQANWLVSTQTRWKTFTSPMKHVSKVATELTQKGTKLLPISHCSEFCFKWPFPPPKKKKILIFYQKIYSYCYIYHHTALKKCVPVIPFGAGRALHEQTLAPCKCVT